MKKIIIVFALIVCTFITNAQTGINVVNNTKQKAATVVNLPDYYKPQADSIRKLYTQSGFELLKAEFLVMESSYERAIVLPLEEGTWYQIVFISDKGAHLQEVFMYDEVERKVMYKKKKWADIDGNVIDEAYIPTHSEYHMLKFTQECKKKKWLTTAFLLFKKTGTSSNIKYVKN